MAIFISKNGKDAQKLEHSSFELEDDLQQYILDNPDSVPLYDIDADTRLFISAREFPTRSGPIDALGFDASGNIYVVETKLYKNPDKRKVVAQALDYGASLWRHATDFERFVAQLNEHTQRQFGVSFAEKYAEFFALEDASDSLQNIKSNLSDGVIKFVVLMDQLHDSLKDLVLFVNQNSKFDLYAVELEHYRHDQFEIVIPRLYGAEVKKEVASTRLRSDRSIPLTEYLDGTPEPVQVLFQELSARLLEIDKRLEHRAVKSFTSFKIGRWNVFGLRTYRDKVVLDLLRTRPEDVQDPEHRVHYRERSFEHYHQHISEIWVHDTSEIDYAVKIALQVYERFSKKDR